MFYKFYPKKQIYLSEGVLYLTQTFNPILGVKITPLPPQEKNVKNGKNRQAAGLPGLFTEQNLVFDIS